MKYVGRGDLFEGLAVWEDEEYRKLQGTYPVISISFAPIKAIDFEGARYSINEVISGLYQKSLFLKDSGLLSDQEVQAFEQVSVEMDAGGACVRLLGGAGSGGKSEPEEKI